MKFKTLLLISLFIANLSQAQIIKLQTGASFNNLNWTLNNKTIGPLYNKLFVGHSLFLGVDYLHQKRYNLSSNIGLLQKGGADEYPESNVNGDLSGNMVQDRAWLKYLSFNTCLEYRLSKKEDAQFFVSAGPRIDVLYSYDKHIKSISEINALKSLSTGLLMGSGCKVNIQNFQVGLRADYYLNFNKIAYWEPSPSNLGGQIKSNTVTVNLSVGYRLNHHKLY